MTTFIAGLGGVLTSDWAQFFGGPLVDLDAVPKVTITSVSTGVVYAGPAATGAGHPAVGIYTWSTTMPWPVDQYLIVWDGFSSGNPVQASEIFELRDASSTTTGPCAWPAAAGTCCSETWEAANPALQLQATEYANLVLWSATGRQFGECTVTVRPCGRMCRTCPQGWFYDGYGTWVPYVWNGVWFNCWCGDGGPGCQNCDPHCQVYLPGPVSAIVSVAVSGAVVPASEYFVLDQQFLVRSNTVACWPQCSNQNVQPGSTGQNLMEVTYLRGKPVPVPLLGARDVLACEYIKACMGQACRLPGRISSLARQGVNISMVDVTELLRMGLTGIAEVDQVIRALNPSGLKGRTRFYSPDLPTPREVTWP
jgi:hypothetical protein